MSIQNWGAIGEAAGGGTYWTGHKWKFHAVFVNYIDSLQVKKQKA